MTTTISIPNQLTPLLVECEKLKLDERNARKHDERNLASLEASIRQFGFNSVVFATPDGTVLAGNARLTIARKLGMPQIPCCYVEADPAQATARGFAIADNRVAELAEWDTAALREQLAALALVDGFDLGSVGFDAEDIAAMVDDEWDPNQGDRPAKRQQVVEDETPPPPPAEPVTKPGDLIVLGRHRLLCGDSTVKASVDRLLGGAKPFLMVTDPPYGVEYDPEWRVEAGLNTESARAGTVRNDDRADWTEAFLLFPGDVAYTWSPAGNLVLATGAALQNAGFGIRNMLIWRKERFAISRGAYHYQHEPCWYAVREGKTARWSGDRTQSSVWDIKRPQVGEGGEDQITNHGTQKPMECMARPIRNHGGPEDDVYEPFAGSGTTVIACEQLGRRCFAMEIDPGYCDVIVARWERFTGRKAERTPA